MTDSIKNTIKKLRKDIEKYNRLYYSEGRSEISDGKYDSLLEKLKELEKKYPEYDSADSPTHTVGAPVPEKFVKVHHTVPMLSLDSINDEAGAERFDAFCRKEAGGKVEYICEPKLDGISIELVYENGKFLMGSTRGDGTIGEDVTLNLKTIVSVPKRLKTKSPPRRLAVRGEVMMHISHFQALNKERAADGKDVFANPRNVAAGSMRQLDYRVTGKRKLEVYCYRILDLYEGIPATHFDALAYLKKMGFQIVPGVKGCSDIKAAIAYHHELERTRDSLDYEIDGVVIKVNDTAFQKELGTRTTNPRWAVAYKFEPRKEITRVEDIVVQVGRTGVLTPLALLQSVEVGGVTVSRATLHNMDQITKLDVNVGDYVKVQRAGDVIPYISEVIKEKRTGKERKFHMPKKCPSCGTSVETEGVFFRCPSGITCPAQLKEAICHYAGKGAVDIDGFSDKTVERFLENGLIRGIADIYALKREDLLGLEGWKQKKIDNFLKAIERAKDVPLGRFVFGLGIKNVGKHIAVLLADHFGTLDKIITAQRDELVEISEVGPEIAENIVTFFKSKKNTMEITKLMKNGVNVRICEENGTGKLIGKKCVFTGSLASMTRSEAIKLIESEGGEAVSSINATIDFVVAGENPGSKLDAANKKGIRVLTEREFKKLFN